MQKNAEIDAIVESRHADPFHVLGPHPVPGGWAIRFFLPYATDASILTVGSVPEKIFPAVKLRPAGFFEAFWPSEQQNAPTPTSYKIQSRTADGNVTVRYDTYAFPYLLSEFDL